MAIVQKSFSLDIVPGYPPPIIYVSEYDIGRSYEITLLNDGAAFTIPNSTVVSLEGTIEDYVMYSERRVRGVFSQDNLSVSNNKIQFQLTDEMTCCPGQVWCKIKLTLNDEPISTCGFILDVDRAGADGTAILPVNGVDPRVKQVIMPYINELRTAIQGLVIGEIPDSVLTAEKIATGAVEFNKLSTAVQELLNSIAEKQDIIQDTNWVNIDAFNSDFRLYSESIKTQWRRIGNVVYLRGQMQPTRTLVPLDGSTAIKYTMFILPEGCRPSRETVFVCQGTGISKWLLMIASNGVVSFSRYSNNEGSINATADVWLPFCISYAL